MINLPQTKKYKLKPEGNSFVLVNNHGHIVNVKKLHSSIMVEIAVALGLQIN